jgi:CubicO group peptidase (beta-lactamase class C family)
MRPDTSLRQLTAALGILISLGSQLDAQPSSRHAVRHAEGVNRSGLPDTPVGRLASGWLTAFNSADSAKLAAFIGANFAPAALGGRPARAAVTRERWRALNLGPARVIRVDSITDSTISVLVHHDMVDGYGHLNLRVTQSGAPLVTALQLTRMEAPPTDLATHGKLSDDQIAESLDRFVAALVQADRFAGAVAVVHDGRVVMTKAYGMADRARHVPNTIVTRFELASVGKMFTAVTIAKLVQQGLLSYDDTLGKWIPEYPNPTARRLVTVRHLLTHSSGIREYFMNPAYDALDKDSLATQPLESLFPYFASDSLEFEPGTQARYSNSGYLLLGIIAERAAKHPYLPLYRAMVLDPASMQATWNAANAQPRPVGYTWYGPMRTLDPATLRVAKDEPVAGSPAGGGISTIDDMARFASALLGDELLSRQSLETMVARHGIDETPTSWSGYGFDAVELWRGARIANKSGNTYGAHSQVDIYPDQGYGVVVLSNLETWTAEAVIYKARELITRR